MKKRKNNKSKFSDHKKLISLTPRYTPKEYQKFLNDIDEIILIHSGLEREDLPWLSKDKYHKPTWIKTIRELRLIIGKFC